MNSFLRLLKSIHLTPVLFFVRVDAKNSPMQVINIVDADCFHKLPENGYVLIGFKRKIKS